MIIAHRGASFVAPENTVAAYKLAWEMGADAAETDVYLTKDNRVVCLHDASLKRTAGVDRKIGDVTFAELEGMDAGSWKGAQYAGEPVPLLSDVLATIPEGKHFFLEIKDGPAIVPFVKEIVEASPRREQVTIIGFSKETMDAVHAAMPEVPVLWLLGAEKGSNGEFLPIPAARLKEALDAGFAGLNVSFKGVSPELLAECREQNAPLYVWTVDDPVVAKELVGKGVVGVTTNKPDLMLEELRGGK